MNWKKIFVKDEDGDTPTATKETPSAKGSVKKPVSLASQPVQQQVTAVVTSGTDYNSVFDDAIKAADLPGPDYKEFAEALMNITQPMTEQQKYEQVYNVFRTMGITPTKLVQAANKYLTVLESRKKSFIEELADARNQGITQKEKQREQNQKLIDEYTKKIQDLTGQNQQLSIDINNTTNELGGEEIAFNNAYDQREALIQNHISNIQLYLDGKPTK